MKKILFMLMCSVWLCHFSPLQAQTNSCLACHLELDDELSAPAEAFKNDVHQKFDLSCTACHGGNSQEEDYDTAKDKSFKGTPQRKDITQLCSACHADSSYMRNYNPSLRVDQLSLYATSKHGQLLKRGDSKVAVCTDCHGIHGIQAATHPQSKTFPWNIPETCGRCHSDENYMQSYGIPTNQDNEYRQSVHAHALFEKKDLSAPTCNDCHGNHGAAPPEVASISYVCRQCHPGTGELFSASPHKTAFQELEISECEACHGNHKILPPTDEMLGTDEKAVCTECHDSGSRPYEIAASIKQKLDTFKGKIEHAEELLETAGQQGVEISEPRFKLQEAITALIQIRNLTHTFSLEKIEEKIEEGDAVILAVSQAGEEALKEAKSRKTGLIIATTFIALLTIAIFLRIKQISKATVSSEENN